MWQSVVKTGDRNYQLMDEESTVRIEKPLQELPAQGQVIHLIDGIPPGIISS
jgi:hypothetical protein